MTYPLISEYVETIESAEDNFATLTNLRPVRGTDGKPVMTSGNFAVVFKMRDTETGKLYAVKCFTKDQLGRAESYRMIADELEYVSSCFLVHFSYHEKELFVDTDKSDEAEFPVLLMDWVEGVNLDQYLRQHLGDEYSLRMLAYQFSKLAMWLMPQPFAHGDVKPDNIMVRDDGSLVLIDYDGMYVPAMKGQKASELGSPDFRHPSRTEDDFDEHIDDFSLVSILLSLRAIAYDPSLLDKYGAPDRLLLSEKDYRDISSCEMLQENFPFPDNELNTLVGLFVIALSKGNLANVSFRLFECRMQSQEIDSLLEKAMAGDAESQFLIGRRYYKGEGVAQDYAEAVKWYRKAAEQGNSKAQNKLGFCYANGEGVPQDYAEAVKWYRKAAEQGNAYAQTNLGICYDKGEGVAQDYAEAVKWYRKAAEQGNAYAQTNLGVRYHNGEGVAQDYAEAVKWLRKAAEQGDYKAQYNLGVCYDKGEGVAQDYAEAVKWYRKAAEQGYANAQNSLGNCYHDGKGVAQDYAEAVKWYRKAAEQGNETAKKKLQGITK